MDCRTCLEHYYTVLCKQLMKKLHVQKYNNIACSVYIIMYVYSSYTSSKPGVYIEKDQPQLNFLQLKGQCDGNTMASILQVVKSFYQLWPVVIQLSSKH